MRIIIFIAFLFSVQLGNAETLYHYRDRDGSETLTRIQPPAGISGVTIIETRSNNMYHITQPDGSSYFTDQRPAELVLQRGSSVSVSAKPGTFPELDTQENLGQLAQSLNPYVEKVGKYRQQIVAALAAIVALYFLSKLAFGSKSRARRQQRRIMNPITETGYTVMSDFIIPTPDNRLAHIDHLVRTPWGFACVRIEDVTGEISGEPDEISWLRKSGRNVQSFFNPLLQNQQCTHAIRSLAPKSKVANLIVFAGKVSFGNAMPRNVIQLDQLHDILTTPAEPVSQSMLDEAWAEINKLALRDPDSRAEFARNEAQSIASSLGTQAL